MIGKIHSLESMGLVDGPGVRFVFFLQGCPLRCTYCHNPDSQNLYGGSEITVEEAVEKVKRIRPYFGENGGVTFSGGEPMLQGEFLSKVLKAMKLEGIHTAVDTSGFAQREYFDEIIKYTDLFLLDIKHYDKDGFYDITKRKITGLDYFINKIAKTDKKIWIRHVMIPGFTDSEEAMKGIFKKIIPVIKNIEKTEILPYHTMGVEKYKVLNRKYELEGIEPMDKEKAKEFEKLLINMIQSNKGIKKVV